MASRREQERIARVVLDAHGRTFASELDIPVERNTPSALFRLLCAALLFSARIRASVAANAARALADHGWTTPEKLAASTWEDRTRVLNGAGYARYDERTATMLGETAALLLDDYAGDLRRLREAAGHDPAAERRRLKAFKGIGDVGVDIFFREVQIAWVELYPFADRTALKAAERLGLPASAPGLADLVDTDDFPRLVAGLLRVHLAKAYDDIEAAARPAK
jgi:endonuclease III